MTSVYALLPLAFASGPSAGRINFSGEFCVLNWPLCTSRKNRDSIPFPGLFEAFVMGNLVNRFRGLKEIKLLRKEATSNLFGYANRRIDRLTRRMLVFAVERIDMSQPVQLKRGIPLTRAVVPAQGSCAGRGGCNFVSSAADFGSSNSVWLPEFVLNNC